MGVNLQQNGGGGGGSSVPTMVSQGFFYPNSLIFSYYDPSNIDPRANGSTANCTSWKQFYLPYAISGGVTTYPPNMTFFA